MKLWRFLVSPIGVELRFTRFGILGKWRRARGSRDDCGFRIAECGIEEQWANCRNRPQYRAGSGSLIESADFRRLHRDDRQEAESRGSRSYFFKALGRKPIGLALAGDGVMSWRMASKTILSCLSYFFSSSSSLRESSALEAIIPRSLTK